MFQGAIMRPLIFRVMISSAKNEIFFPVRCDFLPSRIYLHYTQYVSKWFEDERKIGDWGKQGPIGGRDIKKRRKIKFEIHVDDSSNLTWTVMGAPLGNRLNNFTIWELTLKLHYKIQDGVQIPSTESSEIVVRKSGFILLVLGRRDWREIKKKRGEAGMGSAFFGEREKGLFLVILFFMGRIIIVWSGREVKDSTRVWCIISAAFVVWIFNTLLLSVKYKKIVRKCWKRFKIFKPQD